MINIKCSVFLLFLYLWNNSAHAQQEGQQSIFFRVDGSGEIWVNDIKISRKKGIEAPGEFITLEGLKPTPQYGGDRYIWHVFKKMGVLFERRNDPDSDGMVITLPLYENSDFPGLAYRGKFFLGTTELDFNTAHKLAKEDIVKIINKDGSASWMDSTTLYREHRRTTVYFIFDEKGLFRRISISVPSSDNP